VKAPKGPNDCFPGPLEHFAAYAGSGAIAMAGYELNRGAVRVMQSSLKKIAHQPKLPAATERRRWDQDLHARPH
jgi:hypothetical protein